MNGGALDEPRMKRWNHIPGIWLAIVLISVRGTAEMDLKPLKDCDYPENAQLIFHQFSSQLS